MNLFEINKYIVTQYSFAQAYDDPDNHDPEVHFSENYRALIDYLDDPTKQDTPLDMSVFNQDSTTLPLIVNLHNPYYDPHKYSYDSVECINCGEKNCKNCPIPVTQHKTLGTYLEQIVHPKKFQDNVHLYKEAEQIKMMHEKQDEEVEEEKKQDGGDVEMQAVQGSGGNQYKTSL